MNFRRKKKLRHREGLDQMQVFHRRFGSELHSSTLDVAKRRSAHLSRLVIMMTTGLTCHHACHKENRRVEDQSFQCATCNTDNFAEQHGALSTVQTFFFFFLHSFLLFRAIDDRRRWWVDA